MSPESQAEIDRRTAQLIAEMPLEQLRAARQLTQTNLAQVLGLNQRRVAHPWFCFFHPDYTFGRPILPFFWIG